MKGSTHDPPEAIYRTRRRCPTARRPRLRRHGPGHRDAAERGHEARSAAKPWEPGPTSAPRERRGHANGFKPKTVNSRLGKLELDVPQTRGVEFYPTVLERGERSERALKLAVAEMYVQGVSTRKVAAITAGTLRPGGQQRPGQPRRGALDEELAAWRNRPLGEMPYLILDARYEKIRHGGAVVSCAVLVAIGVTTEGARSILGVSVSLSEAEVHWREFLASLQDRGLHGVRYVVSDDHAGLKEARQARLAGVPWQRCQFHLAQNALHYVPSVAMRSEVARDLRGVLDAGDRPEADRRLAQLVTEVRRGGAQAGRLAGGERARRR